MISDEKVQQDIITELKTITSVTTLLGDGASGIKELQWQGDTFSYPCVRVDLERDVYEFDEQEKCALQHITFSIYIFSQERSTFECSKIKGLLESYLTGLGFAGLYAKYMRLRLMDNLSAVREDSLTWRSQLQYSTRAYP
jgi:hypothetical protein